MRIRLLILALVGYGLLGDARAAEGTDLTVGVFRLIEPPASIWDPSRCFHSAARQTLTDSDLQTFVRESNSTHLRPAARWGSALVFHYIDLATRLLPLELKR